MGAPSGVSTGPPDQSQRRRHAARPAGPSPAAGASPLARSRWVARLDGTRCATGTGTRGRPTRRQPPSSNRTPLSASAQGGLVYGHASRGSAKPSAVPSGVERADATYVRQGPRSRGAGDEPVTRDVRTSSRPRQMGRQMGRQIGRRGAPTSAPLPCPERWVSRAGPLSAATPRDRQPGLARGGAPRRGRSRAQKRPRSGPRSRRPPEHGAPRHRRHVPPSPVVLSHLTAMSLGS